LVQDSLGKLTTHLDESISGVRVIKAFNAEKHAEQKFNVENDLLRHNITKLIRRRDLSSPLSEFLGVTVVAILLYIGARFVFSHTIRPEVFFSFVFAFYQIIEPSKSFTTAWYNVQKGMAALDRVDLVLNEKESISSKEEAETKNSFDHNIVFDNVSFKYSMDQALILDGLSFTINKGQSIAIVGHSGSGKSTILDLILRFQDVTFGSIKIDGIDIRDLSLKDLRSLFGVVTQDTILFHDSIEQNILMGRSYDPLKIEKALVDSDSLGFINDVQLGVHTVIGDRGMRLSGGQKQRLSIARAILNDPPILLLDEATSALDTESEKNVQKALQLSMKGRTSIIVAHRLSTITSCDMIIVLEQGKIIEIGKHHELMQKQGRYFDLIHLQAMV
jgi:subfamily B ATP-binding cassette protein MsbA